MAALIGLSHWLPTATRSATVADRTKTRGLRLGCGARYSLARGKGMMWPAWQTREVNGNKVIFARRENEKE